MVVLAASLGKQLRFQARAQLLWQTLEAVESEAPPGATIAWVCGDPRHGGLDVEEGIHFRWHLQARGRTDLEVALVDSAGEPLRRVELTPSEPWRALSRRRQTGWTDQLTFEERASLKQTYGEQAASYLDSGVFARCKESNFGAI